MSSPTSTDESGGVPRVQQPEGSALLSEMGQKIKFDLPIPPSVSGGNVLGSESHVLAISLDSLFRMDNLTDPSVSLTIDKSGCSSQQRLVVKLDVSSNMPGNARDNLWSENDQDFKDLIQKFHQEVRAHSKLEEQAFAYISSITQRILYFEPQSWADLCSKLKGDHPTVRFTEFGKPLEDKFYPVAFALYFLKQFIVPGVAITQIPDNQENVLFKENPTVALDLVKYKNNFEPVIQLLHVFLAALKQETPSGTIFDVPIKMNQTIHCEQIAIDLRVLFSYRQRPWKVASLMLNLEKENITSASFTRDRSLDIREATSSQTTGIVFTTTQEIWDANFGPQVEKILNPMKSP